MYKQFRASTPSILTRLALAVGAIWLAAPAGAQTAGPQAVHFRVDGAAQRLEMIVNTSRILTLDHNVPRLLVMNPEIVEAQPLSPNQIQVSARHPGVTQLNVWDDAKTLHTVDVVVYGDARELENVLNTLFPDASLQLSPLPSSIAISGYVPRPDMVGQIVRIAEDFYPKVINNMTVGGVQQVLLYVKVMEVSRTKLRQLGFDWANFNGDDFAVQTVSGLIGAHSGGAALHEVISSGGETLSFGIMDDNNSFFGLLQALRQYNLVKVLAEPTLVTISGRPASFNSGGEFPILVPQSLGTVSVEYRQFGTRVDFVPIVLGNGAIRLEVRPQVSEIDPARSVTINDITVPGLRTRWVDTAVEMKAGQTLALAGLIQNRVESENRGIPWASDLPWVGAAFRRVEERNNEIELLITVTPEFVEAMDPHETPQCGPGEATTTPSDCDLYFRGYLEVPKCCGQGTCPSCQNGAMHAAPGLEGLPVGVENAVAPPAVEHAVPLPAVEHAVPPPAAEDPSPPAVEQAAPAEAPLSHSSRRVRRGPSYAPASQWISDQDDPPRMGGTVDDRYSPNNPPAVVVEEAPDPDNQAPEFLGPIGYDVLK